MPVVTARLGARNTSRPLVRITQEGPSRRRVVATTPRREVGGPCTCDQGSRGGHPRSPGFYPGHVPTTLRLLLAALLLLAGVVLVVLAVLGATGRLPRNRFAGVRTADSLRTADAFAIANRVAAPPVGAAGAIALVGGTVLLVLDRTGAAPWVLGAIALVGTVVLAGLGGAVGARAAAAAIAAQAAAPSCGGVCAGCDLVAGCRDATGTEPGSEPGARTGLTREA
ncbi:hypothetical protein DMP15_02780 [Pseudonocardia sp. UM4_GMWB1]